MSYANNFVIDSISGRSSDSLLLKNDKKAEFLKTVEVDEVLVELCWPIELGTVRQDSPFDNPI